MYYFRMQVLNDNKYNNLFINLKIWTHRIITKCTINIQKLNIVQVWSSGGGSRAGGGGYGGITSGGGIGMLSPPWALARSVSLTICL